MAWRGVLVAFTLALVALSPSALAAWGSYGSLEPDTSHDRGAGPMWTDAPGNATRRVYFNVVSEESAGRQGPSPNAAALGGRVEAQGSEGFTALLGVWADCNHDGYVGFAEGALREYRAEASVAAGFPIDPVACPVTPDAAQNAGAIHNNGQWITELIPIGPLPPKLDWRYLQDVSAKVWGDAAEPVTPDPPPPPGPDACAQSSVAFGKGQAGHTGGMLQHVDCLDGGQPWSLRQRAVETDPTSSLAAHPSPQALYRDGGPLDKPTFGSDEAGHSVVSGEQDCSEAPLVDVDRSLGSPSPGHGRGPRPPAAPRVDPSGTLPATVNETREESVADDCDPTDDPGRDFYGQVETDRADGVSTARKASAEIAFVFRQSNNRAACVGLASAACGQPTDLGAPEAYGAAQDATGWVGAASYVGGHTTPGGVSVDRATLQARPDLVPATWLSFHAVVTLGDVVLPGGHGTYGAEFCTQGIGRHAPPTNGWDCDPAGWNLDPLTGEKAGDAAARGTVGDVYGLRDVDCEDATLLAADAGGSPTGGDVGPRSAGPLVDPAHGCH